MKTLCMFLVVILSGCATYRDDKAELKECREQLVPACQNIAAGYSEQKSEIEFYKVRIKLCDDLNESLMLSNKLLRDKEPEKKTPKTPAKKYLGNPRHVEPS